MKKNFDPMAVKSGQMAASGDDTEVTISGGGVDVTTTIGGMKRAARMASTNVSVDHLRAFIERIERLEEERGAIIGDIKEVYGEAKSTGFDTKTIRKVVAIRKKDRNDYLEEMSILDTYLAALGMIEGRE